MPATFRFVIFLLLLSAAITLVIYGLWRLYIALSKPASAPASEPKKRKKR